MKYSEYVDLGFVRTDCNDDVEFRQTGFSGFSLSKDFGKGMSISVSSGDLRTPRLYIETAFQDRYHIIPITPECVIDICNNNSKL